MERPSICDKPVRSSKQETTEIKHRIRMAWASFAEHRLDLTSRSYLLQHRLRLFDAVITPSMLCGAGTKTGTREREKMIRSTQLKVLRLIVQTRRAYKNKSREENEEKDMTDDERSDDVPPAKSEEKSTSIEHNQDSSVSFESDTDDSTSGAETEEEDWIDKIKRSTRESEEKMRTFNISCWIETERKLKWRLAIRIASHSGERWTKKQQEGTQASAPQQKQADTLEDQERDGKTTSTNPSEMTKLKSQKKTTKRTTTHGSKQQGTKKRTKEKEYATYRQPKPTQP